MDWFKHGKSRTTSYDSAMRDIHDIILGFRDFVAVNWDFITELDVKDETDSVRIDWLQANWEMIVERQLRIPQIILEIYGDGADNGKSSRIHYPEEFPTHRVVCIPHKNKTVFDCLNKGEIPVTSAPSQFVLDRFVSMRSDGWCYEEPPFDKVLCFIDNTEVVLNIADISFQMIEI